MKAASVNINHYPVKTRIDKHLEWLPKKFKGQLQIPGKYLTNSKVWRYISK
jgi:hypothetical protein